MCDSWPATGWSTTAPARSTRARPLVVVRDGRRAAGGAEHARREPRRGVGDALERPERGEDEEQRADERRDRVPGQAEDERRAADGERERLAGTHRDSPEVLLHAELGERPADEVVRADRDAAGGDERRRPRAPRRARRGARPRRPRRRRAARRSRPPPRAAPRASGRSTRRSRRRRAPRPAGRSSVPVVTIATRGRRAQRGSATPPARARRAATRRARVPRASTRSPAPTSPPADADVGSRRRRRIEHDDVAVRSVDVLDRHDRVGAFRHDAARRDPHRLAGLEPAARGTPAATRATTGSAPGVSGGPEREAVHGRAREARQVDQRVGVLGEHPAGRLLERHGLRRERRDAGQDARERLVDGQQLGHGADGTHGVRSPA